ncbi:hypothetical protein BURMUCGD1_4366 [Burkholderia multivorans CGD1]|nr:hypothetical protein BURMUCGD1_4366 [Burkholderia multivorans CGD1]
MQRSFPSAGSDARCLRAHPFSSIVSVNDGETGHAVTFFLI